MKNSPKVTPVVIYKADREKVSDIIYTKDRVGNLVLAKGIYVISECSADGSMRSFLKPEDMIMMVIHFDNPEDAGAFKEICIENRVDVVQASPQVRCEADNLTKSFQR